MYLNKFGDLNLTFIRLIILNSLAADSGYLALVCKLQIVVDRNFFPCRDCNIVNSFAFTPSSRCLPFLGCETTRAEAEGKDQSGPPRGRNGGEEKISCGRKTKCHVIIAVGVPSYPSPPPPLPPVFPVFPSYGWPSARPGAEQKAQRKTIGGDRKMDPFMSTNISEWREKEKERGRSHRL